MLKWAYSPLNKKPLTYLVAAVATGPASGKIYQTTFNQLLTMKLYEIYSMLVALQVLVQLCDT